MNIITRSSVWNGEPTIEYGDTDISTGANTVKRIHDNWDIALSGAIEGIFDSYRDFMGYDNYHNINLKNLNLHILSFTNEVRYFTESYYKDTNSFSQDFIDDHKRIKNNFLNDKITMSKLDYSKLLSCVGQACVSYTLTSDEIKRQNETSAEHSGRNWLNVSLKSYEVGTSAYNNSGYVYISFLSTALRQLGQGVIDKIIEIDTPKEEDAA